jgi:hypothetical protein
MSDLWWTKWHWDRFSPSTSVFPRQFHSTGAPLLGKTKKTLIIFITGLSNKPQGCGASVASAAGPFTKNKRKKCVSGASVIQKQSACAVLYCHLWPVRLWPSSSMRKDRHTDMTKLIVVFRNFAKAPKNTETVHLLTKLTQDGKL